MSLPVSESQRNRINALLETLWSTLFSVQDSYVSRQGRYLQLGVSSSLPDGSVDLATDRSGMLAGHDKQWSDIGLPEQMPVRVHVDEYDAPDGRGFVLYAAIDVRPKGVWERGMSFGPETASEFDWRRLPADVS